jgi:hypothetical protein
MCKRMPQSSKRLTRVFLSSALSEKGLLILIKQPDPCPAQVSDISLFE